MKSVFDTMKQLLTSKRFLKPAAAATLAALAAFGIEFPEGFETAAEGAILAVGAAVAAYLGRPDKPVR